MRLDAPSALNNSRSSLSTLDSVDCGSLGYPSDGASRPESCEGMGLWADDRSMCSCDDKVTEAARMAAAGASSGRAGTAARICAGHPCTAISSSANLATRASKAERAAGSAIACRDSVLRKTLT
eukprot:scaffold9641_cov116-Isochrysis_galbana.AAC.3